MPGKREKGRPILVSAGVAMFIIGFLITVVFSAAGSIDGTSPASEATIVDSDARHLSTFENLMAFLGIFIGLLGVVTATVGPLMTVVVPKSRR